MSACSELNHLSNCEKQFLPLCTRKKIFSVMHDLCSTSCPVVLICRECFFQVLMWNLLKQITLFPVAAILAVSLVKQIHGMYVTCDNRIVFNVTVFSLNFLSHVTYLHLFQVSIRGYR